MPFNQKKSHMLIFFRVQEVVVKLLLHVFLQRPLTAQKVQQLLHAENASSANVRRRSDKYVPKDQGNLKNTFQFAPDGSSITYMMPYARKQYTIPYRHSDPLRCQYWDRAMMAAEGDAVVRELETFLKGRTGK